jgi:hypothetical protein
MNRNLLIAKFKLWGHCLLRFHRQVAATWEGRTIYLYCGDCGKEFYLAPSHTKMEKIVSADLRAIHKAHLKMHLQQRRQKRENLVPPKEEGQG